jgi:hypothetical protein
VGAFIHIVGDDERGSVLISLEIVQRPAQACAGLCRSFETPLYAPQQDKSPHFLGDSSGRMQVCASTSGRSDFQPRSIPTPGSYLTLGV